MSSSITVGSNTYTLIPLPTYPGLSEISLTMNDSVAVVPSPYVPSQVQTQAWPGADAWSLEFTLPKMNVQTAAPWRGFMAELRGMQNVFQIGDPYATAPQGSAPGTPTVATSGSNNLPMSTSLYTAGWTPSRTNILLPGDYIQLGYHLHVCCEAANSDSGGLSTISIWPSLRESPANGYFPILWNAKGLFRLAQNSRTWHNDFARLMSVSFKAMEVR